MCEHCQTHHSTTLPNNHELADTTLLQHKHCIHGKSVNADLIHAEQTLHTLRLCSKRAKLVIDTSICLLKLNVSVYVAAQHLEAT
jgi:hypothetical protein